MPRLLAATTALLAGATLAAQTPVRVEFQCTEEDFQTFGLDCTGESPCPVYLELSAVAGAGERIVVSGNLHTAAQTLYAVVLLSEDGGKTWAEPQARIRAASLDQIQFADSETGWIGGQYLVPLPRDPFLLITNDGGKSWRLSPVYEESKPGTLDQFWFDTKTAGQLVISRPAEGKRELWESMTGGNGWTLKEVTTRPVRLARREDLEWRIRADASSKTNRIERRQGNEWLSVASFRIEVGKCRPPAPKEPQE